MNTQSDSRPITLYILSACLLFLSVSALFGGYAMISDATGGAIDLPQEWLEGTIFPTYLVPGLFLFLVFGVGSLIVLYALWTRPKSGPLISTREHWAWTATWVLGVLLVLWILIQYVLLQLYHPLLLVMGVLGVAIVALDLLPDIRRYLES